MSNWSGELGADCVFWGNDILMVIRSTQEVNTSESFWVTAVDIGGDLEVRVRIKRVGGGGLIIQRTASIKLDRRAIMVFAVLSSGTKMALCRALECLRRHRTRLNISMNHPFRVNTETRRRWLLFYRSVMEDCLSVTINPSPIQLRQSCCFR